jgi:hypothetical protein
MEFKMKKYSVFILFFTIFQMLLAAQQISDRPLVSVDSILIGSGDGHLGFTERISSDAPTTPSFVYGTKKLYIYDIINNRIIEYIDNGNLSTLINLSEPEYIPWHATFVPEYSSAIILSGTFNGIKILDTDSVAYISYTDFPEFHNYRSFAYYDDVLFVHDAELNLWSIPEPVIDQDENRAKLLNERQTREYVNERWGATGEVQVDGEGRLFIDGQLVTRDYQQFWQYMEEAHGPVSLGGEIADSGIPVRISYNTKPYFLGRDLNGNWYWNDSGGILVHSPVGSLINVFITELGTLPIRPAIDQLGNVYILDRSDTDEVFNRKRSIHPAFLI